ncbi:MAG: UDP-glucose 4-epimerase GalE [Pseudomonadota bacterium]
MAKVLVAGGAGYVGAHACLRLREKGHEVVIYDDLSSGHLAFVQGGPFIRGDIRDRERLNAAFETVQPDAVMHFAARIEVGWSMTHAAECFDVNVGGSAALIDACVRHGVKAMVFSSTCAVYGDPQTPALRESHQVRPISPYGRSKAIVESMLEEVEMRGGLRSARLRYFNAAGADPRARIGEAHEPETHLIPLILQVAAGQRDAISVFGNSYSTRDGTAVRDYVHVCDLADAHVLALEALLAGERGFVANLGSETGYTVREVIKACERVTGQPIKQIAAERRFGDAPSLIADAAFAHRTLGWTPGRDLDTIIEDAWRWEQSRGDQTCWSKVG